RVAENPVSALRGRNRERAEHAAGVADVHGAEQRVLGASGTGRVARGGGRPQRIADVRGRRLVADLHAISPAARAVLETDAPVDAGAPEAEQRDAGVAALLERGPHRGRVVLVVRPEGVRLVAADR